MSDYKKIYVETFRPRSHEPTDANIRVRPLPGQGYTTDMRVECSRKMRDDYPIGTVFEISCKLTNKEGGTDFLYAHYNSMFRVIDRRTLRSAKPELFQDL